MFSVARAEIITGTLTAIVSSGGWTSEVLPIMSGIGVIAGSLVAVHGLCKIIYGYYKLWRYR